MSDLDQDTLREIYNQNIANTIGAQKVIQKRAPPKNILPPFTVADSGKSLKVTAGGTLEWVTSCTPN